MYAAITSSSVGSVPVEGPPDCQNDKYIYIYICLYIRNGFKLCGFGFVDTLSTHSYYILSLFFEVVINAKHKSTDMDLSPIFLAILVGCLFSATARWITVTCTAAYLLVLVPINRSVLRRKTSEAERFDGLNLIEDRQDRPDGFEYVLA
jgi:hypothetical protein